MGLALQPTVQSIMLCSIMVGTEPQLSSASEHRLTMPKPKQLIDISEVNLLVCTSDLERPKSENPAALADLHGPLDTSYVLPSFKSQGSFRITEEVYA